MVMHATSYDVLVGGVVLYPSGLPLVFGRKLHIIAQIGKLELVTSFIVIRGQTWKSNRSTMLARFSNLPHGLKSCWNVMSMSRMHLLMVNWRC
jgi:hypothetical protein